LLLIPIYAVADAFFLSQKFQLLDTAGNCDPLCSADEVSSQYFEANYKPKNDLLKALTIIGTALTGAAAINHSWVAANQVSWFVASVQKFPYLSF
jgi:hypothetical protein